MSTQMTPDVSMPTVEGPSAESEVIDLTPMLAERQRLAARETLFLALFAGFAALFFVLV
ncbi:MAG: hypothetical protein K6T76_00325 [Alicyclobacillus mali]|uniref:hypothetical protein n=1 Tax=Alicyclobacillus mali (ex Roth et al. 2021) TaxID=1123961 RepID=UPI0023F05061|nr:hypothetical protein [Alicyclobacillus mali (ex Roth et al. 2021)]MCL6487373.1 hypothetical protein [Alicyclobacillus mali (ex Roth et al. 2021)]